MSKDKILKDFKEKVNVLKREGRQWGLNEEEINFIIDESLAYVNEKYPDLCFQQQPTTFHKCLSYWRTRSFLTKLCVVFLMFILLFYGLSFHKPAHNFVERNIQEAIYPFMKIYRQLTLPLVQLFPSLTEYYDESCLVENPYFRVSNMDCWPCENIRAVLNLTQSKLNYHVGLPYILKVNDSLVKFSALQNVYKEYKYLFDNNAASVYSTYINWNKISDVLEHDLESNPTEDMDAHVTWRINRMEPARVLRPLVHPPKNVPHYASSIGIERYILIDETKSAPYHLPNTEGANVFIKQLLGHRLIFFDPTPECSHVCHRLSVVLEEQHILWYNWWYWRPKSLPVSNSTTMSLALMGSTI